MKKREKNDGDRPKPGGEGVCHGKQAKEERETEERHWRNIERSKRTRRTLSQRN